MGLKQPGLARLVPQPGEQIDKPTVWFCGHCGTRPEGELGHAHARVCESCKLGLLLESDADVAPAKNQAFMVLDGTLSVCALSKHAETLLATTETEAVNRHVTELLVPADAEGSTPTSLAAAVTWAARGDETTRSVVVRPARTFGVRLRARIASCGPPRAALLVFDG